IPALAIGIAYSKIIPGIAVQGDFVFGTPGIMRILESWIMPGVHPADILVHPVARAAWAGVLATALNLMPIGQLDGGHILYSFVGDIHRRLSKIFVAALVGVALFAAIKHQDFWVGMPWLIWAVFLSLFALRH